MRVLLAERRTVSARPFPQCDRRSTDQEKQCGTAHVCVVSGFGPALAQFASATTALSVVSRHCTVCVCNPLAPHEGPHAPKPSASHE